MVVWEMSDGDMTGIESDISYRAVETAYASYASYAGPENKGAFLTADFSRRPLFLLTSVSDSTFLADSLCDQQHRKGERLLRHSAGRVICVF